MTHPRILSIAAETRRVCASLERRGGPMVDLAIRVTLAPIFFRSALQKLSDWPATLYLFEYEYRVPLLPTQAAAGLAAAAELAMPVLLVLGLGTRLAAVPLLGVTLVIQFVVAAANPAFAHFQHYLWMLLLLHLIVRGGGALSLDRWIADRLASSETDGSASQRQPAGTMP